MSINNLPSAVGCLCVSTALALCELSVTGTSYSSRRSGWGLFDSHVNPPQVRVTRKGRTWGILVMMQRGMSLQGVFFFLSFLIKSSVSLCRTLWCKSDLYFFIYLIYCWCPVKKALQYVHVRKGLTAKVSLNQHTCHSKCTLFKLCTISLGTFSGDWVFSLSSLGLGFHGCFELRVEISKILQDRTHTHYKKTNILH